MYGPADRKIVDFSGVEATFAVARKSLPTVTGLRIQCGGDWYFLIAACYNTEILVLRDSLECDATMSEVSKLKNLRHLELYKRCWHDEDIEAVHEHVPDIESLALKGGMFEAKELTVRVALSNLLCGTDYSGQTWTKLFASFKRCKLAYSCRLKSLQANHVVLLSAHLSNTHRRVARGMAVRRFIL